MTIVRRNTILLLFCILSTGFALKASAAQNQGVTKQQLQTLVPGQQDLQGFMQVRPVGELPEGWSPGVWSPQTQTVIVPVSPAIPLDDEVALGDFSTLSRTFYSRNGLYRMTMLVELCPTPAAAAEALATYRQSCQSSFSPGAFDARPAVGDESWVLPSMMGGTDNVLITRIGRMIVWVAGGLSSSAARHQVRTEFPRAAVEAAAYQVLLRASQQAALTGVSARMAQMTVNGHAQPKGALTVGKQVYVPVKAFARAVGLTSGWDAKTGALTLSGPKRKTVSLTAGSTEAKVGGLKAAALAVPVLKDGGEPVMALLDLLRLTGGRVTSYAGGTVQVKG